MTLKFSLPYPPSVNNYVRRRKGGRGMFKTHEAKAYTDNVKAAVWTVMCSPKLPTRVRVVALVYPPDAACRDLDNLLKCLLDAMSAAGVWIDDEQIDDLRIVRRAIVAGGRVDVLVREIGPATVKPPKRKRSKSGCATTIPRRLKSSGGPTGRVSLSEAKRLGLLPAKQPTKAASVRN